MDGLASYFMLFVAAIVALLTYAIVQFTPMAVLVLVASVGLVAGLWWHWTQFSVDYRTSTWQEQLRNYASYVMVAVVILASYTFYVFGWGGVSRAMRNVSANVASNVGAATNTTGSALMAAVAPLQNLGQNIGQNLGFNMNRNRNRNAGAGGSENLAGRNMILE